MEYALLNSVILSDLERLSRIFDDTKHYTASLRQQSYLLYFLLLTDKRPVSEVSVIYCSAS